MTEAPCATPNHVWGWCRRGRVGFAPTRHPSYSPHLSRLFAGSGPFGFEHLPLKPLHMSWTTRHPSRPTGKSWNVVPAAGEHNAWGTIKRHPATYLNHGPMSSLVSSQGATSPPLPNGCGRELIGPSLYRDQKGKHLVYGMQQAQTAPRRKARRADEATAIAISPRPPERPGALPKFRVSQ